VSREHVGMRLVDDKGVRVGGSDCRQEIEIGAHIPGAEADRQIVLDLARHQDALPPRRHIDLSAGGREVVLGHTAQHELRFARESIKEIVEESAALVREGLRKAPRIELDIPPHLHAEVCRARLVQALTNLMANAVESYDGLPAATPVAVTAQTAENRVVITIEDRGCGMSDEVLADAAVLFSTSKPDGTGFGLPLAVKIIESEHDGRLALESRKGYGTTARVVLPIHHRRERA